MKNNKKCKILLLFAIMMIAFTICSVCYAESEKITEDLELSGTIGVADVIIYQSDIKVDGEYIALSVKASDFNLPPNLYNYRDDIRFRLTYSKEDYTVYDCKVINYRTGEIIEDLSEENIEKMFNIEYGKDISEKDWSDKVKLSDLEENKIYKYTANETTQFPTIENDTGKNCVVYIKGRLNQNYERKINMYKEIRGVSFHFSYDEYKKGEEFYISYKSIENSELLKIVEQDKVIYLSEYKDGDKLEYIKDFKKYIYNDTENDIIINTKDKIGEKEFTNSSVIGKGEIYGFNWMIDSASISYVKTSEKEDNSNTDIENKVDNDNKQNSNDDKNNNKENKDNTIIPDSKLPKTGTSNIVIILSLSFITIMSVIIIKLRNLKDIK